MVRDRGSLANDARGRTPPRVSILLPIRDAAATLAESAASLSAQTWRDFEVIAVDDGSTDDTPALLAAWAANDTRVRPLRIESPGNIARALGHAATAATATLLARFDADDLALPERLEKQLAYLDAHPEIDVVATRTRTIGLGSRGPTEGAQRYAAWLDAAVTHEEIARALWVESPLPHPTVLFRRTAYERVGGYADRGWPEDYDLWLRMLLSGSRFAKLPEVLHLWRDHPERASRVQGAYATDRFLACRSHYLTKFAQGRSLVIWGAGRDGRRLSRALLAEGARLERFLDIDPRKIGRTARGRPIVSAEGWLAERGPLDASLVVAAVGTAGARELIRERLSRAGLIEGRDFICAA